MIMVQKPVHLLSSPMSHRRHPSAPPAVLVQSTRTPGLLSLSKPAHPTPVRQQQHQQQQRIPRSAKGKAGNGRSPQLTQAQAQPIEDAKKPAARKDDVAAKSLAPSTTTSQSAGRKNNNNNHKRSSLQPQPTNLPSQAEVSPASKRITPIRSQSLHIRDSLSSDPFLVNNHSDSDSDAAPPTPSKPAPVRPSPKLTSRPTGKLARRRQNAPDAPSTPTPARAVPVSRAQAKTGRDSTHPALNLSRSVPTVSSMSTRVQASRPAFPVCDDLTDAEDDLFAPSTPMRAKVDPATTWQQSLAFDDGPRTAPLSSAFGGFPFYPKTSTPTPDRKRRHFRSPSEGVFNMSMDDDNSFSSSSSSSDASEELKAMVGLLPRRIPSATSTPGLSSSAKKQRPVFFASSKFQNSPSPDELPAPAFGF
ncbi:hypothetical protein FA95DRAFT_1489757 [Auriscalpium vulgare]|uniref:Uncharacterized protein n=1 Tax=Auriscalpium vulgare TaxID=40419 RepID=A0ACB8S007_9AGAM|nr:hypothetical protein FA95DRAFT_1489757 [Auriscalpium vulgare]